MTEHISKLGEIVDPGSDKIADEELELNAAGKLKDNDNESEGVMSEVGNTTKDANGKDVDSPHWDLAKVGRSFVYTVEKNKVDKNQNVSNILASINKHTLTNWQERTTKHQDETDLHDIFGNMDNDDIAV